MNKLLFVFLYMVPCLAFSQKRLQMPANNRVIVNFIDHAVHAQFLPTGYKLSTDEHLHYYWYSNNDIKRTRGGYDGKLLHGPYADFYPNKNLREKGQFRYGLKSGEWKSWHFNGEYKEIVQWKKGGYLGRFRLFDEQGNLIREGRYVDNKLEGKIKEYDSAGKTKKVKYRNGILVVRKRNKRSDKANASPVTAVEPKGKKFLGIFGRKKFTNKDSITVQSARPDTAHSSRKRGMRWFPFKKNPSPKDSLIGISPNTTSLPAVPSQPVDSTKNNPARKRSGLFRKKKPEIVAPPAIQDPMDTSSPPPIRAPRRKKKDNG